MCENHECSICLDVVVLSVNCVITECGHKFHTSCLMKNVVHNGFDCPNCRTKMAVEPDEDDDPYGDDNTDIDNSSDFDGESVYTPANDPRPYNDAIMLTFRMFMNRVEGEEISREDISLDRLLFESTNHEMIDTTVLMNISNISNRQGFVPLVSDYIEELKHHGVTYETLTRILLTYGNFRPEDMYSEEEHMVMTLLDDYLDSYEGPYTYPYEVAPEQPSSPVEPEEHDQNQTPEEDAQPKIYLDWSKVTMTRGTDYEKLNIEPIEYDALEVA